MSTHTVPLGERMKSYETSPRLDISKGPIIARMDGRSFSRYTAHLTKPFDPRLSQAMINVTKYLLKETGAAIGYTQSDEITIVFFQSENENSKMFFDGKIQKLVSVLASTTSVKFFEEIKETIPELSSKHLPAFDARVFQVPSVEEVANCILWRCKDATKNSVQMAARTSGITKSEMFKVATPGLIDLLETKEITFSEYPKYFREGTLLKRESRLMTVEHNGVEVTATRTVFEELVPNGTFIGISTSERIELLTKAKPQEEQP